MPAASGCEGSAPSSCVKITPFQQMIASCSGAILTSLLVTPLDVVKIRLQAQQKPAAFTKGHCFLYCNGLMDHVCSVHNGNGNGLPPEDCLLHQSNQAALRTWFRRPSPFNGTLDAFVKIARNEGVTSLWSGLPPTMVMAVPATVVYFTAYDQLKYMMGFRECDPNTQYVPVLAGSVARVFAATLISPLELVRTKLQSEQLGYLAVGRAVREAIAQDGLVTLMKGLGPTLLRDVPFSAIYWFGYEYLKVKQLQYSRHLEPTFVQSFVAGAVSGSIAAVITLPFDVVKTHRQIELGEETLGSRNRPSSTWKLISHLYKQQGVSGLFTGLVPRLVKVAPACAIMISTYEFGKAFFRKYNAREAHESGLVSVSS